MPAIRRHCLRWGCADAHHPCQPFVAGPVRLCSSVRCAYSLPRFRVPLLRLSRMIPPPFGMFLYVGFAHPRIVMW